MPALRKPPVSETKIVEHWEGALVLGAAVIAVVAVLLNSLTRTVQQIEEGAAEIWRVGKLIANNTVHIPLLARTNQLAAEILEAAGGIVQATERIRRAVAGSEESS